MFLLSLLARALSGDAAYDTEFRMLRADGGERWVLARGTVLRDDVGRPVRVVGIDLYESADLRTVDLCKIMRDLAARIGPLSPSVSVHCASDGSVPIDAERRIPIGLIANELLTNAVRHVYPEGTNGTVEVRAEEQGYEIVLSISDTGRGMPEEASCKPPELGSALIRSLARQVGARVEVATKPGLRAPG